uniref:glucosamine inositolphosphorylceramide transferase family protein n=1 Tax=Alistipes sp. TaxID=1872444 RepID=UPI0040566755
MKILNFFKQLHNNRWNIGFIECQQEKDIDIKPENIKWLKHDYKDRWFADPFILEISDKEIVVLVEEFCYKLKRGRIAKLTIDKKSYQLLSMKIILDLETHLSFPYIYTYQGTTYVLPENSQSGSSSIYRYEWEKGELHKVKEIAAIPLIDAIIYDNKLLATLPPNQNGIELKIYEFDQHNMTVLKLIKTVYFNQNYARNAGAVLNWAGDLFRPAQDCTNGYGKGVILQNISADFSISSTPHISLYPNSFLYNLGLHTFNLKNNLIVVDGRGYRYPIVGRILTFFIKWLKYFK